MTASPPPAGPLASRINPQIFSLIAVSLLAHITMSGGRVSASLFVLQNGHSQAMAGVAYSLFSLFPALLSLHMGRWIDRVGVQRVMRISLAIMIVGLALPTLWPSLPLVLLMSALGGLGFGTYMLAANVSVSYMKLTRESDRVGMLAWLQMGNSVSAVAGPSLVGLIIDGFGFRYAFALMASMVVASLIVSFRVSLPESMPQSRAKGDGSIVREVFGNPRLLRIYLLAMTVSLSWDAFAFMVPVLGHERGYSATTIGLVLSAFACGTFTIRAALPWLSAHLPEWRLLSFAFGLTASVFLFLPWAAYSLLLAGLGFTFGLAAGVGQPAILNLIYRAMPPGRQGEGAGLRASMGNCMGLTGPSVFGAVSAWLGAMPVFLGIAGVMAVATWQASLGYRAAREGG